MKLNTLLASAAVLLTASTASADLTIRVTGSSAFRASTVNAIKNLMSCGANQGYAYTGTSFTGATDHIFVGTATGVTGVLTVQCRWSGSVAGIKALNNNENVSFLSLNTTGSPTGTGTTYALSSSGTALGSTGAGLDNIDTSAPAQIVLADNTQSSTKYTSTALTAVKVGIIPFAFVASASMPAAVTNITPQLAQTLYSTGYTSAALFTNNNADAYDQPSSTRIYAMGRDPLSGTRLVSFAESGVGAQSVVSQYYRVANTGSSPSQAISEIALTLASGTIVEGDNGETSGGTLADQLRYLSTSVTDNTNAITGPAAFIAYLGESDAARAVNGTGSSVNGTSANGCRYLSYNGVNAFGGSVISVTASTTNGSATVTIPSTAGLVAGQLVRSTTGQIPGDTTILSITNATTLVLSKNATATSASVAFATSNLLPNAIWNGAYTVWGYEYSMRRALTGESLTFFNALNTRIKNTDYFYSGLSETSMRVSRSSDGGTISPNY
jgi:hypothetical protein